MAESNPFLEATRKIPEEEENPFLQSTPMGGVVVNAVPPQPEIMTPDEKEARRRERIAFALGAGKGATYGASNLIPAYKKKYEEYKGLAPGALEGGEMAGGVASAFLPFSPEALALKGAAPVAGGLARLLEKVPFVGSGAGSIASGAIKGAGIGAAGQAAREGTRVLETGDPINIENIASAAKNSAIAGGVAEPLLDLAKFGLNRGKIATYENSIPEDAKNIADRGRYRYEQRIGAERPKFKENPSMTEDIISERIHGDKSAIESDAAQKIPVVHEEMNGILKKGDGWGQLSNSTDAVNINGVIQPGLKQKFIQKNSGWIKDVMRGASQDDIEKFNEKIGSLLSNYDADLKKNVAATFTPSQLNDLKQSLYRRAGSKSYQNDPTGLEKQLVKRVSLFVKDEVNNAVARGIDLGVFDPADLGKIRALNRRSGALQDLESRANAAPSPSVIKSFGSPGRLALMGGGAASRLLGAPDSATIALAGLGGGAGLADYITSYPQFSSRAASLMDLLEQATKKSSPAILRALGAAQEKK